MKKIIACLFFLGVICLWSCNNNTPETKPAAHSDSATQKKILHAEAVAGNFSNQTVLHFDSLSITDFLKKYPDFKVYANDLKKFYSSRNYSYAWYDESGLIEQAASLFNRFEQLGQEGLEAKLPYTNFFEALMDDNDSLLHREPMNAEAELMLTSQYFSFARHVWQGIPETESKKLDWFLPRKKIDLQILMDSLLHDSNKSFVSHEPVYRQYALLKTFLEKYRTVQSAGGWPLIASEKRSYRKGDSGEVMLTIRKRLFAGDDLAGDTVSSVFGEDLEKAVKSFQKRYGYKEDGIITPALIREMNTPVSALIEKIIVNMERCRWVPADLQNDYLVVNIPAYKLYVYSGDSLQWDMNIVAGQPMHKTVIFNGNLKYVVFSPYWNVPPGILQKEILPGMRRDPNYLKKHNMEKVGTTVRQKPGPNNSLGKVKFLFPNSYNIYMHDTPAKNLFNEDARAFSHGCIRLAEPKKLAQYLLKDSPEWTSEKIDAAMNAGKEKYVTLAKEMPVFIAYFTAWVAQDGKLNLRQDIYKRDARLGKMILAE